MHTHWWVVHTVLTSISVFFLLQSWTYFWPSPMPPPSGTYETGVCDGDQGQTPGSWRQASGAVTITSRGQQLILPTPSSHTHPSPSRLRTSLRPPQSSRALQYHLFHLFGTNIVEINHSSWVSVFWIKTEVAPNSSVICLSTKENRKIIKILKGNFLHSSSI